MQIDMFDGVSVTLDDLKIWLLNIPRHGDANRKNHVLEYISNYGVVNKIKAAKLNKSFYCLNDTSNDDMQSLSKHLETLTKPRFKLGSPHIPQREILRRGLTV